MDRNHVVLVLPSGCWLSLSARRAWIEIKSSIEEVSKYVVALRKESVDRNSIESANITVSTTSLSARRAWIEMAVQELIPLTDPGRSPQGERG